MSVTMSKGDGVTVFTVTSDPKSSVPPICQILRSLCCSPVCCSVSERLRRLQGAALSALGALQILVGLLHIGLGTLLIVSRGGSWWQMDATGFPYWLGGLFMLFGILCILSERFPSPCLAVVTLILNLCGMAFAIAAIALYSINMANIGFWWMCRDNRDDWGYESTRAKATQAPDSRLKTSCLDGKDVLIMVVQGVNSLLIILSALQLCLSITASALGIRALKKSGDVEEKANFDPEIYNPLLEEDDAGAS